MRVALSINAYDAVEARDLLLRAPHIVGHDGIVHIDVHDTSFQDVMVPRDVKTEVHLMVCDWEVRLVPWLEAGVFRIIIQVGFAGVDEARRAREVAARYGAEIMLSIALEDTIHHIAPYIGFTAFQILAVPMGQSGQKCSESALERIAILRAAVPDAILEIDGGMTPITVARAKEAGADIAVSSSYIWGAENPKDAYSALSRI